MNTEDRVETAENTTCSPEENSTAVPEAAQAPQLVLMGVAGSGKSAVGLELARMTGWDFHDADDFHPPENKAKMRGGISLTDEDRKPWLENLHDLLARYAGDRRPVILACSALKRRYRKVLAGDLSTVLFVYMKGSFETFRRRMERRKHHYMKAGMLESQLDTLEEPDPRREAAITLDVDRGAPGELAEEVCRRISLCF